MIAAFLSVLVFTAACMDEPSGSCLPDGVNEATVVEVITRQTVDGFVKDKVTVRDRLKKLNAKCRKGKLIDGTGKPIKFFHLTGCWGNPPDNYQEIIERQSQQLESLKKDNTVVEIPCNPDPMLPPMGVPR